MSQNADNFYFRAKEKGYRSRAAFKLLEMHSKYGFMKENLTILEIGSSPGGCTDVIMDWKPAKLICVDIYGIREPDHGYRYELCRNPEGRSVGQD